MNITANTLVHRHPDLKLQLDSSNELRIRLGDDIFSCGSHGLAVLDAFDQPRTIGEALKLLQPQIAGAQDWINLTNTLTQLYSAGVLRDEAYTPQPNSTNPYDRDAAHVQMELLNDPAVVDRLLEGIREMVQPGDIVLDIGTGAGLFAIAAAQAGARHVYTLAESSGQELAFANIAANGFADRISFLDGPLSTLTLPEQADILIGEQLAISPSSAWAIETIAQARAHLLKPGARIMPLHTRIYAQPVIIPRSLLLARTFLPEVVRDWHAWYGIDFTPFVDIAARSSQCLSVAPADARHWPACSAPLLLAEHAMPTADSATIDVASTGVAQIAGSINGVLISEQIQLTPNIILSFQPEQEPSSNLYHCIVWLLPATAPLQPGDSFTLTYQYRPWKADTCVSISAATTQPAQFAAMEV